MPYTHASINMDGMVCVHVRDPKNFHLCTFLSPSPNQKTWEFPTPDDKNEE